MRYLLIINGAPFHRPFYAQVGARLTAQGHSVVYAADSHYTEYLHPDAKLDGPTYVFSDFFEKNYSTAKMPTEFMDMNVWTAIYPDIDRAEYSRFMRRDLPDWYPRLAANLGAFFKNIFDEHKIDCVVYENVSNSFVYMAYNVAERYGAKYIGFVASRFPGRMDVVNYKHLRNTQMAEIYHDIVAGCREIPADVLATTRSYLQDFRNQYPTYMRNVESGNPLKRFLKRPRIERALRSFWFYAREREHFPFVYQISNPLVFPQEFMKDTIRGFRRKYLFDRYYQQPDFDEPFFLYPIQFHPESTVSVDAAYYNDEYEVIRNTSINMPYGVKLYVKDHFHAAGREPLSLYERIERLPNVKIIDCRFPSRMLIERAKAVVTCTSTVGYEAAILGVPVFLFGNPFYEFHPLCTRVRSFDDAFATFAKYKDRTVTEAQTEAFVASYLLCSIQGAADLQEGLQDGKTIDAVTQAILRYSEQSASARASAEATQ